MLYRHIFFGLLIFFVFGINAEKVSDNDTLSIGITSQNEELDTVERSHEEEKAERRAQKEAEKALEEAEEAKNNLQFSFLAGPGYNPDYGFLIGGSFLFTFKTDTTDAKLPRSVIPVGFSLVSSGGLNFFSKPTLFFKEDKFRIYPEFTISTLVKSYYGVGYGHISTVTASDTTTCYRENLIQLKPTFAFRLGNTPLFIGPVVDFSVRDIKDPSAGVIADSVYQAQGGDSTGDQLWDVGVGFDVQYDTRDVPANAYTGLYLDAKVYGYFDFLGSTQQFGAIELEYRQYKELPIESKRKVFAWNAKMRQTFGNTPWSDLSTVGSIYDLRGYPLGKYRDAAIMYGLAEYRHMFNVGSETKMQEFWSRWGFILWGGIGAIGPTFYHLEGALPNYGMGLRFELQPRMNFRMDLGRDPLSDDWLFYLSVTEAF